MGQGWAELAPCHGRGDRRHRLALGGTSTWTQWPRTLGVAPPWGAELQGCSGVGHSGPGSAWGAVGPDPLKALFQPRLCCGSLWVSPPVPAAVAGAEVAALGQQRRWQSYFVRVGLLSAKLRHRALRRSLGELQWAWHKAQHVLAQLHRAFELVRMRWGPRQHQGVLVPPWGAPTSLPCPADRADAAGHGWAPVRHPAAAPPHVAGVEPAGGCAHGGKRGTGLGTHGGH